MAFQCWEWSYQEWIHRYSPPISQAIPHMCPVCKGKGTVPVDFYNHADTGTNNSTAPEKCKTCLGTGIVWDYCY